MQRSYAAAVEGAAGFTGEQSQGARRRPGRPVDAVVGKGVVDVCDREDADLELEVARGPLVGVAAGVEALVMALHESQDERREAAELGEQLATPAPDGGGSPQTRHR